MIIWHAIVAVHNWLNSQPFLVSCVACGAYYWWGFRNGKKVGGQE